MTSGRASEERFIPNKGKTRITIFIDSDILEWFRDEAEREGRGYQTAINQALRNYIKQDKRPIQEIVREAVRRELRELKKQANEFRFSLHFILHALRQ